MSKLVSGDAKIDDLNIVREAATALRWTVHTHIDGVRVSYFGGLDAVCDIVIQPQGEDNKYGHDVGSKYTIGFQQDQTTGKVTMLHDNAMDGAEQYSIESGQQDQTTQRVVGKLKQAISEVQLRRIYAAHRVSWRSEVRADQAHVHVIYRG